MISWIKRHWVLTLFLFVGSMPAALNYSGFCFEQKRWLSNDDRIRLAIERINNAGTINFYHSPGIGFIAPNYIKYKDTQEFIDMNASCCKVNPGGPYDLPSPLFIERITGSNSGKVIEINFTANYIDDHGNTNSRKIKSQGFQTNCGKVK